MTEPETRTMTQIDLAALVGPFERTLMAKGLQALWRERIAAWTVAAGVAAERQQQAPDQKDFGIADVEQLLARIGAAPAA